MAWKWVEAFEHPNRRVRGTASLVAIYFCDTYMYSAGVVDRLHREGQAQPPKAVWCSLLAMPQTP